MTNGYVKLSGLRPTHCNWKNSLIASIGVELFEYALMIVFQAKRGGEMDELSKISRANSTETEHAEII